MVRKAKISDVSAIAHIHFLQLNTDFLSSLGENFLRLLYEVLIKNKKIIILVYEDKGKVLGFVSGAKNFDENFKKIIFNNLIKFLLKIIPSAIKNPKLLRNLFETIFYTNQQLDIHVKSELLSIAIDNKFHRQGIGKKLVYELEKILINEKATSYKVSVNKTNKKANLFYKSLNFIKKGEYLLYNRKINIYLKKI